MKLDAFAITVYRQPDVAEACLTLQEIIGLDVPILLYCAWFGYCYGDMKDVLLAQAVEKSTPYANMVVKPLRHARRWMKDVAQNQNGMHTAENSQPWHKLREQIKAVEISAELLWLEALESITGQHELKHQTETHNTDLVNNMQRYCQTLRSIRELEDLDVPLLLSRIAGACQSLGREPKTADHNAQKANLR